MIITTNQDTAMKLTEIIVVLPAVSAAFIDMDDNAPEVVQNYQRWRQRRLVVVLFSQTVTVEAPCLDADILHLLKRVAATTNCNLATYQLTSLDTVSTTVPILYILLPDVHIRTIEDFQEAAVTQLLRRWTFIQRIWVHVPLAPMSHCWRQVRYLAKVLLCTRVYRIFYTWKCTSLR